MSGSWWSAARAPPSRPESTCGCLAARRWRARNRCPAPPTRDSRTGSPSARRGLTGSGTPPSCRWPRCTGTLSVREPTLGLVPDLLGTKPLVDMAGLPRALELCLTGRSVAAPEAQALRLAELVVPLADLDAAVGDLVAAILALDPATARATKALLAQAPGHTPQQQAAAERRAQAAL